eukprot:m.335679 g.335679  ORF g.335679 m.335679 type:complete len:235 (+) comp16529_c0_seq84:36-740(+)
MAEAVAGFLVTLVVESSSGAAAASAGLGAAIVHATVMPLVLFATAIAATQVAMAATITTVFACSQIKAARKRRGEHGVLKIGQHDGPGPKIVDLPISEGISLAVSPTPVNKDASNHHDRFSVEVRGKQVIVTRVDEGEHNGGWGQHLALKWSVRNSGVLHVGRNDGAAPLVIHLPAERIAVSNVPINQQEKDWMDRFDVSVQGTQLTITRVDQPGGWTQELQLEYFGEPKYPLP